MAGKACCFTRRFHEHRHSGGIVYGAGGVNGGIIVGAYDDDIFTIRGSRFFDRAQVLTDPIRLANIKVPKNSLCNI